MGGVLALEGRMVVMPEREQEGELSGALCWSRGRVHVVISCVLCSVIITSEEYCHIPRNMPTVGCYVGSVLGGKHHDPNKGRMGICMGG